MKREDKIKLLNDIAAGHKTICKELSPILRICKPDKDNPELYYCTATGLTSRRDEMLPDEMTGRENVPP